MVQNIAVMGDSITAAGFATSSNAKRFLIEGWASWAGFYLGGACPLAWQNFGKNGDTSSDMLARFNTVIAAKPDLLLIMCGTNDLGSANMPLSSFMSNIMQMQRLANSARIRLGFIAPLPRFDLSAEGEQRRQAYKDALKALRQSGAIAHYIDTEYAFGPLAQAQARFYRNGDDIHISSAGAERVGWAVARQLRGELALAPDLPMDAGDQYDSSVRPFGNIIENANLSVDGTVTTAQHSGSIADGLLAKFDTGWTSATGSLQLHHDADGSAAAQSVTIQGTAPSNAGDAIHYLYLTSLPLPAGTQSYAFGGQLRLLNVTGASSVYLQVKDSGSSNKYHEVGRQMDVEQMPTPEPIALEMTSGLLTRASGSTKLELRIITRALAGAPVNVSYELRNPWIRFQA